MKKATIILTDFNPCAIEGERFQIMDIGQINLSSLDVQKPEPTMLSKADATEEKFQFPWFLAAAVASGFLIRRRMLKKKKP